MKKILLIALFLLAACMDKEAAGPAQEAGVNKPLAIASNYPLYVFAQEIAGDAVEVRFPDIAGDPATWSPDGEAAALLQTADLIILNGAGYESWLSFITVPEDRLLDTTAGLGDQLIPMDVAVHQHGPEGEHSHPGMAITTWLDPQIAIAQARVIEQAFATLLPKHSAEFETGFSQLETRLQALDHSMQQAFEPLQGQPVVFSHPVYQYLQNHFGINGRSVHWEPGEEPGVRDWIDFQNLLREHPAKLMIWEDQPLSEIQTRLEQTGIRSMVFQPTGNRPEHGDYFTVMEANMQRLAVALSATAE